MLASVENISTDAIEIDSAIQVIRSTTFAQTLAEEENFAYSSSNLEVSIQRTTPMRILGHSFAASGSNSKITLPVTGLVQSVAMDSTDESTVIDTELKEYSPWVSASGASSAVVDFTMFEIGQYTGNGISYLDNAVELQPSSLTEEVTVEIQVTNMPVDFNPQCVYASAYDSISKTTTWSTEGVTIHEVKREESVVVCKSTHLSRFTANDDVLTQLPTEPLIEEIKAIEKDSEDDKDSDIFPIMIGIAGFLVLIMIVVSLRQRRAKIAIGTTGRQTESNTNYISNLSSLHANRQKRGIPSSPPANQNTTARELPTERQVDTYSVESPRVAKDMANSEYAVEAFTPVKWIGDDKPRYLDRHFDDLFSKRRASPEMPSEPQTALSSQDPNYHSSKPVLVPIKQGISLLTAHLIFGGCRRSSYSTTVRTSVFCTALLGEIALFGICLVMFEGTDVFGSYNASDPQPDYDITRDSILAGVSVLIQLCLSILMVNLYSRQPKAAYFANILLIFAYVTATVILSVFYTKYWTMIWLVGFGIAFIIEILLAQTILMVCIYCMHSK